MDMYEQIMHAKEVKLEIKARANEIMAERKAKQNELAVQIVNHAREKKRA